MRFGCARAAAAVYGSPLERPIADVQEDVRQGYVSVAAAAELYGVVIDPETFEIDHVATARHAFKFGKQMRRRFAAGALGLIIR